MSEELTKGLKALIRKEAERLVEKRERRKEKEGERETAASGKWIQKAIKHPGALHAELHVPEGKKIPEKKLEKAMHSKNPTMRRQANFAETLKNFKRRT